MTERPSGWFDDPDDDAQLRYFDGVVWTSHTAAKRPIVPPPRPDAPGAGAPDPGPYAPARGGGGGGRSRGDTRGYAPWWRRVLAYLVDVFLVALVAAPFLFESAQAVADGTNAWLRRAQDAVATGATAPTFPPELAADIARVGLVQLAVYLAYELGFLAWRGATPGRMLLGLRVESAAGGRAPFHLVARRTVIKLASNVLGTVPVLGFVANVFQIVDYLWPLWDERNQSLHDKAGDTVVVRGRGRPEPADPRDAATGDRTRRGVRRGR